MDDDDLKSLSFLQV